MPPLRMSTVLFAAVPLCFVEYAIKFYFHEQTRILLCYCITIVINIPVSQSLQHACLLWISSVEYTSFYLFK